MARKETKPIKIRAKAEVGAVAKATYSRKRTISEVIPPDVTRAKAGAWLDIISPFTEWAGLKGDELRHRRELLRLQREDVLARIAKKCRITLGPRQEISRPIPTKFLVPFLEQASLEDPDSSLVDLWANLLASAAQEYSSHHIHFVGVISRLSTQQGEILKTIITTNSVDALERSIDDMILWLPEHQVHDTFIGSVNAMIKEKGQECTDDDLCDLISRTMTRPGVSMVHASAENLETEEYFDIEIDNLTYQDRLEVDYSILEAIGLIRHVNTNFFEAGNWSLCLMYYHLTTLGFHFAKACKIVT